MTLRTLILLGCLVFLFPACGGGDDDDTQGDDDATTDDDDATAGDDDDATAGDDDDATAGDDDDTAQPELEECDVPGDCTHPNADCPQLLQWLGYTEATSYCYLDCTADPQICGDTPYASTCYPTEPDPPVSHCLGEVRVVGTFTDEIAGGTNQANASIEITISGGAPVAIEDCSVERATNPVMFSLHCASADMGNGFVRHLDLDWDGASHQAGAPITSYSGYVMDLHYTGQDLDDMWTRGLLWFTPGITLTDAGTADGDTIAGSLDMTGVRYEAQLDLTP